MTKPKQKFDRALAIKAAKQLVDCLKPFSDRLILAGSLRRRKLTVGDLEILYIPQFKDEQVDLLTVAPVNQFDKMLEFLIEEKIIAKRKNVNSSEVWGDKNKLAVHVPTGIPVDFFSTKTECWFNYMVYRTGGALNNIRIAEAYQRLGCKWNPYGPGFTAQWGEQHANPTERDVFEHCELRYLEPHERP